ncbi:MAG: hypothetical protein ACREWG_09540 [Gammaproteobacteria bacterium]
MKITTAATTTQTEILQLCNEAKSRVIYTDDASGGAGNGDDSQHHHNGLSGAEGFRQPGDQCAKTSLSQPSVSLMRSACDMGSF